MLAILNDLSLVDIRDIRGPFSSIHKLQIDPFFHSHAPIYFINRHIVFVRDGGWRS